ncbi:MAG: glycerol-3-phosphate acyltransferase [Ignavibacteriae bacterium]|nr:glycerol-3-phosphate acyltransferase [Ignavibacteriota bacterium]
MTRYALSLLLGYFVGSLPTAYLLVKWKTRLDIRKTGSGNVGAMNTFEVTGSKLLGAIVMLLDLLKGVAAVGLSWMLVGEEFWIIGIGGLGSIIGHTYPIWLKFKGGRGLSTAAGMMLVLGWIFVVVWCTLWTVVYVTSKNIHASNITASMITPVVIAVTPTDLVRVTLPLFIGANNFIYLSIILCLLLLLGHREPIAELLKSFNKKNL